MSFDPFSSRVRNTDTHLSPSQSRADGQPSPAGIYELRDGPVPGVQWPGSRGAAAEECQRKAGVWGRRLQQEGLSFACIAASGCSVETSAMIPLHAHLLLSHIHSRT